MRTGCGAIPNSKPSPSPAVDFSYGLKGDRVRGPFVFRSASGNPCLRSAPKDSSAHSRSYMKARS
jgi:hypothetical protein